MAAKTGRVRRGSTYAKRSRTTHSPESILDVTVVLLDGGHPSTAIGPIEVFDAAGTLWNWFHGEARRPRFRVRTASVDGASVSGLKSLQLTPQCAIKDVRKTDIIILSTSHWELQNQIMDETPLIDWLRKWHARGAYIAGICTSVAYLAASGLLNGRRATTHWGVAETLRTRFPQVHWCPEQFITDDHRLLCSGGVYASIDLSLYLVEKFCGHEIALQCAKSLLVSMPRARQSGYSTLTLSRAHADEKIREAEDYLQKRYARAVSIEVLANRAGMSPRNFIRRFKSATGHLPGAYVQTLRMTAAKEMLERGAMSIQQVSAKIGYEDVAFFRGLFKRHTGMTPADYRARFGKVILERGDPIADRASVIQAII